jgi:multidrug efflux pump subunit AcrA (membrane-fusion protein)
MYKKKWFWILIALLIIVMAGGGYYYYASVRAAASATTTQETTMQTAVAHRGDMVISGSGSGSVVTAAQFSLAFKETTGTLIELNVGVSDKVHKGDILARLQTDQTAEEITATISAAELTVIQAQQALDELYVTAGTSRTTAMNDIATYAQAVRDAQYQLENYSMPLFLQGLDTITAVDKTKAALDAASAAFEPVKYYPVTDERRKALLVTLNETQSDYDAAIKRLNYEYVLQVAQDNLNKARQDYEKHKNGPAASDLILAETTLKNAKDKLTLAKEEKSIVDLLAPIDGTIMTVNASVGEAMGTTSIITLADLENLRVEAYLDESDLDKAKVGNEVEVIFDALPDQTFKGKVVTVSPGLETVSNVQAVKVIVILDDVPSSVTLPIGLSASVDVISGRAENAVLVPVEALRQLDTGEYGVFVVQNGTPALRVVKVGLQDVTSAEIISGLQVGEIVSTGITQTK